MVVVVADVAAAVETGKVIAAAAAGVAVGQFEGILRKEKIAAAEEFGTMEMVAAAE